MVLLIFLSNASKKGDNFGKRNPKIFRGLGLWDFEMKLRLYTVYNWNEMKLQLVYWILYTIPLFDFYSKSCYDIMGKYIYKYKIGYCIQSAHKKIPLAKLWLAGPPSIRGSGWNGELSPSYIYIITEIWKIVKY